MTDRVKDSQGIVRHRSSKGWWNRVENKDSFSENWDGIKKPCKGCGKMIPLGPEYCKDCKNSK